MLYAKEKPSRETLERLVAKLEDPVDHLVRKDSVFAKMGLEASDYLDRPEAVVDILLRKPVLMQRPVVETDGVAIIGRPKDRIRTLLGAG